MEVFLMIIESYHGIEPVIAESCFVAQGTSIIGAVTIGENCSVWYGTVIRGDMEPVTIGANTSIQDNAVIHVQHGYPTVIGENVAVGHNAIVHGAVIEDNCLIGMGAIILDNVHIGRGSIIGAGSVVKENSIIPPFSLVVGVPGEIVRTLPPETETERHDHALVYAALAREYINNS
jgi:carbonic anhydrase/acetyltransferase-like protein (isoleucine patch superfamily)